MMVLNKLTEKYSSHHLSLIYHWYPIKLWNVKVNLSFIMYRIQYRMSILSYLCEKKNTLLLLNRLCQVSVARSLFIILSDSDNSECFFLSLFKKKNFHSLCICQILPSLINKLSDWTTSGICLENLASNHEYSITDNLSYSVSAYGLLLKMPWNVFRELKKNMNVIVLDKISKQIELLGKKRQMYLTNRGNLWLSNSAGY